MKYKFLSKVMALAALMLCAFITTIATPAFAAFEIHLKEGLSAFVELIFVVVAPVITVILGFAARAFTRKTKIEVEDSMRAYIDEAIHNGLHFAKSRILDHTNRIENPTVKSAVVATAANYVLNKVPDALHYFGIEDKNDLEERISARLEKALASS